MEKLDFRTYSIYFSVNESAYFSEYFGIHKFKNNTLNISKELKKKFSLRN